MKTQATTEVTGKGLALAFLYNLLTNPRKEVTLFSNSIYCKNEVLDILTDEGYITKKYLEGADKIIITPENLERIESKIDIDHFILKYFLGLMEGERFPAKFFFRKLFA